MFRHLIPIVTAAVLVAGCGSGGPPKVMFSAGTNEVESGPTQHCTIDLTDCTSNPAAAVQLPIPAGLPVLITVPKDIAESPWQVVFRYRDSSGKQTDGRTKVFAPKERDTYTLDLPAKTDQLQTVEVQQYGPPPQAKPDTGEVEFPIRASWVLTTAPGS